MALTIWSNLTERQRAMAIPFQLVSQIFMEFPVHIRIYVIIRGKESETKNSLLGNNYRICDNLIFNDTLEEFNVFSLAQVKLRVDCIKLKLILQWGVWGSSLRSYSFSSMKIYRKIGVT